MFKEDVFIKALTERREDARKFSQTFKPEWLTSAPLRPILAAIYSFLMEYDVPPNLKVYIPITSPAKFGRLFECI